MMLPTQPYLMDPYSTLWCVFLWERPQMRFTELQLNTRERVGQTSVQSKLCPTSLASAPKRKLTIRCCMGFYGQQSVILARMHARPHARTCAILFFLFSSTYLLAIQSKQFSSSPSGVVVSIMDCWTEGCGFESCWTPFFVWGYLRLRLKFDHLTIQRFGE